RPVRRARREHAALRPAAWRLHLQREAAAPVEERDQPDAREAREVGERGRVLGLDLDRARGVRGGARLVRRVLASRPRRARVADDADLEAALWRRHAGATSTSIPFTTALFDSGSTSRPGARRLLFTPGWRRATPRRVSSLSCPQPCGRLTTPGIISS